MTAQAASGGWGPMTSLDRVYNALADGGFNPTGRQRDFKALCPAHDERTPSLHITWKHSADGGRILLYCHGCQAKDREIAQALGLTVMDLFDNPPPEREQRFETSRVGRAPRTRQGGKRRGKLGPLPKKRVVSAPLDDHEHQLVEVEVYPYTDTAGTVVQEVVRKACSSCGSKEFVQRYVGRDCEMQATKPEDFVPVLYRQPAVVAAVRDGREIWILEGEKDVHSAEELGLVATTNTGGGRNFTDLLAAHFSGGSVRVVLDRDATGWARGLQVHQRLHAAQALEVRLYLPAVTTAKADLTDHLEAGHSLDDLVEVSIDDVRILDARARVEAAHAKIQDSLDEIDFHLAEAKKRQDKAPKTAEQHRQWAERWVVETELRWETIANAADEFVQIVAGHRDERAQEAAVYIERLLVQATATVKAAHDQLSKGLPEDLLERADAAIGAVQNSAAAETTDGVDDVNSAPSSSSAEIFEFPSGQRGSGSGGGGSTSYKPHIQRKQYAQVAGCIVEVKTSSKVIKGEEVWENKYVQVINLDLQLDGREYVDSTGDLEDEVRDLLASQEAEAGPQAIVTERKASHYLFAYTDPRNHQRVTIRVEEDRARAGDFLDNIDIPGLQYDHTKSGKMRVIEAIRAMSASSVDHVQYRGTGWRMDPTHGWVYVSSTGLITKNGVVPGHQLLLGSLARYALPRPSIDAAELRRFFYDHSAVFLERFSPRIGAVLCGQAYTAPIRRNPYSIVVVGSPGSKKTGLCALAMHHHGTAWDRTRPTASMTGDGATINAAKIIANQAKDTVAFFDDVTPGSNSGAAQARLGDFIQMLYNQSVRDRSSRDGELLRPGHVPHTTALFSSEITPKFGANARRSLIVPVQRHELELNDLIELDHIESRMARATLTASMIGWAAKDLTKARQISREAIDRYAQTMRDAGRTNEEAESTSYLWGGWSVMTQFLVEVGAITALERTEILQKAHEGLNAAIDVAQDPDSPTTVGHRLREIIANGLRSGIGHVTDVRTDDTPRGAHDTEEDGLAIRLGWRRDPRAYTSADNRVRMEARGMRIGYANLEAGELLLDSTTLEAFIKAAAAGLSEPFTMDAGTARRALHEIGVLKAQQDGSRFRYTMKRTIYCERHASIAGARPERAVTVLRLAELLGDVDDGDQILPPAPVGPAPVGPGTDGSDPSPDSDTDEPTSASVSSVTEEQSSDHEGQDKMHDVDESNTAVVKLLTSEVECAWCHKPCRTMVDDVPLHSACWGEICVQTAPPAQPTVETAVVPGPNVDVPDTSDTASSATTVSEPAPRAVPKKAATVLPRADRFTAAAAVVDIDVTYLPDGSTIPTPVVNHLGDLAQIAYDLNLGTQVTKPSGANRGFANPGVVVATDALARKLGVVTEDLPRDGAQRATAFAAAHTDHRAVVEALAHGWRASEHVGTNLKAWNKLWREGEAGVHVTFEAMLSSTIRSGGASPAAIARRLGEFARLVGTSWHLSAHATGSDLMTTLRRERKTEFVVHEVPRPATSLGDPDLDWSRRPTEDELDLPYVHAYDRGGSHLAGVASLELPVGDFEHHPDAREFDPSLPGYWRIEMPAAGDWRYPHPLYKPRARDEDWVTTPTLELAMSLDYAPRVLEAYVWPEHARVLDPWYRKIRDARTATDVEGDEDLAVVRSMIKEVYTRTIGMMGSATHMEGKNTYYPERRHHIVAKARANLLRRVIQIGNDTGTWPLAVKTDTILYASNEQDPVKAWPGRAEHFGRGLGQFKVEGTGKLAAQLPHLTGQRWSGDAKALLSGVPVEGDE